MSDLFYKVKYTPLGSTEVMDIDDINKITISRGSEIKNDNMTIILKNDPVDYFGTGVVWHKWVTKENTSMFRVIKATSKDAIPEEPLDVYVTYSESVPALDVYNTDYFLFSGIINKGRIEYKEDSHTIELTCRNRSAVILDRVSFPQTYTPQSANNTSPKIIQAVVRLATKNTGFITNGFNMGYYENGTQGKHGPYLIDARLFSEGVMSSGNATSTSACKLIDAGATFISDGVEKGDYTRNTTDNTYSYVNSVDSEIQLTLGKDIFISGEGYQVSNAFIQDRRIDGSTFPTISFSQVDKPVTESIEDLSQVEKTNTTDETDVDGVLIVKRGMRWFIDKHNRFHWYYPSDTPEYVVEVGQTAAVSPDTVYHRIQAVELTNEVDDKVNFIVFRAGYDMDGEVIRSYARAPFSGIPNRKDSLRNWLSISRAMKDEDLKAGNITKVSYDEYNYPGSYPKTPAWDRNEVAVNNDNDYNTNFKAEAILRGKELAQAIFQRMANPRWKGSIQIRGEDINVGDLIQFTSREHGINNIKVRVSGVSHTITPETGWTTSLSVEEDELEREKG